MTKLGDALRRRFRTPEDALRVLGLDTSLIDDGEGSAANGDNTETTMTVVKLSPKAAVARGALFSFLRPRLAQDAKIELNPILAGVTAKNFGEKRPAITAAVSAAVKGKLAKDADIEDLAQLLDALDKDGEAVDAEMVTDPNAAVPPVEKKEGEDSPDMLAKIKEFLKGHVAPEILDQLDGLAADEDDEDDEKKKENPFAAAADEDDDDKTPKPGGAMDKKAMDAALAAERKKTAMAVDEAVKKSIETQKAIRAAERVVRPLVGELALDSAETADDVYRLALVAKGVKTDGVPAGGFGAMLDALSKTGVWNRPMAQDAAPSDLSDYEKRFPNAARIGRA